VFVSDHPLLCPDLSFFVGPSPSYHRVFLSGPSSQCLHSLICLCTLNIIYLSYLYSRVCFRTIIYATSLYCLNIDQSLSSHYTMCSYPNHHLLTPSALCLYQDRPTSTSVFCFSIRTILSAGFTIVLRCA
jgi:hypothetical protein